jgi:hypothetical protein
MVVFTVSIKHAYCYIVQQIKRRKKKTLVRDKPDISVTIKLCCKFVKNVLKSPEK